MANRRDPRGNNVLPFTPRRRASIPPILRLSPEYDGMELLYANDQHPDTLFSIKILAWARREDGDTVAVVPWLKELVSATDLADPLNGRWEGYRLPTHLPHRQSVDVDRSVTPAAAPGRCSRARMPSCRHHHLSWIPRSPPTE